MTICLKERLLGAAVRVHQTACVARYPRRQHRQNTHAAYEKTRAQGRNNSRLRAALGILVAPRSCTACRTDQASTWAFWAA